MDAGHKFTDKRIDDAKKDARGVYSRAEARCKALVNKYLSKHKQGLKTQSEALEAGTITKDEYRTWVMANVFNDEWKALISKLAEEMTNANIEGARIANEAMASVYAENYNYGVFLTEGGR